LQSPITSESWKMLSSRPIRGAESDPIKEPSRVLYNLLKRMLEAFSSKFPKVCPDQTTGYPVLKGCDDYLERLQDVKLDSSRMMETTLLTADFGDAFTETGIDRLQESISIGDAFTETGIDRLQESISTIGNIVALDISTIDLMRKLVVLVFTNCYFYTPSGLYRQSRGMPMGDYSSRFVN
jgi:hypothetical protein